MRYVIGYSVSILVAIPVTWLWARMLHHLIRNLDGCEASALESVPWAPVLIGIFERAMITTMIAWSVSGSGSFIGAWLAIKSAGAWSWWGRDTPYGRATFFIRLLGSSVSILFALCGGIVIQTTH
jgi:hypothetical protein